MKSFVILGVFCAALVAFAQIAAADATNCKDEARYPEIEKKELKELVAKKKVFVVDVNSKESFAELHVPGALHFGSSEKVFEKKLPKDKAALIVSYCGGPMCTAWKKAAERACALGYTNVKHFKGGIEGWREGS